MSVELTGTRGGVDFDRPLIRALLRPELPVLAFTGVLILALAPTAQGFLTTANLQQILSSVAVLAIVALGLNQVILAGEIDISVGSGLAICAWAAGSVGLAYGSPALTLLTAVGLGTAIGLVNGVLIVKGRIPSIIVTLAMLNVLRGLELVFNSVGVAGVPENSRIFGNGTVLGLDAQVVVLVAAFAIVELLMRHTSWGRDVAAVGGNRRAARQAGLSVDGIRFLTFGLTGLCVGIAAMVHIGEVAAVQSNTGTGFELQVIAAVVIGGTSIMGGRGSTLGPVVGAILIGTMLNGMSLLGIAERWQSVFTGGVILLAIASDVVRGRLLRRLVDS